MLGETPAALAFARGDPQRQARRLRGRPHPCGGSIGSSTGDAVCQSSTADCVWPAPTITSSVLGSRVSVSLLASDPSHSPAPPPKRYSLIHHMPKLGLLFQ